MIDLLERIKQTPGCLVLPQAGVPTLEHGHILTEDLRAFYSACGGIELFTDAPFPVRISRPDELALANPVIIGERYPDLSDSWYLIGRGGGDEFISIDLAPERAGRCYDSFREVHGVPGSDPIIAQSFTDLIERLYKNGGQHWYWLESNFTSLGDAYDAVR
jgi:hypothetical protein